MAGLADTDLSSLHSERSDTHLLSGSTPPNSQPSTNPTSRASSAATSFDNSKAAIHDVQPETLDASQPIKASQTRKFLKRSAASGQPLSKPSSSKMAVEAKKPNSAWKAMRSSAMAAFSRHKTSESHNAQATEADEDDSAITLGQSKADEPAPASEEAAADQQRDSATSVENASSNGDIIGDFNMDWEPEKLNMPASPAKYPPAAASSQRRKSTRSGNIMEKAGKVVESLRNQTSRKRAREEEEPTSEGPSESEVKAILKKKQDGKRLTEGERLIYDDFNKKREMEEHEKKNRVALTKKMTWADLDNIEKGVGMAGGWAYNYDKDLLRTLKKQRVEKGDGPTEDATQSANDSAPTQAKKTVSKPPLRKKYLKQGLYVGQHRDADPSLKPGTNAKRMKESTEENRFLPMPMFAGAALLERGRDFKLNWDIHCPPEKGLPKPPKWKNIPKNRFVGDAKEQWKIKKPEGTSYCVCEPEDGCRESCINRHTSLDCNDNLCLAGAESCTNRPFAELQKRIEKGTQYEIGVNVYPYKGKGFGVRANRCFDADQIIIEYSGEIINENEVQRRMLEEYQGQENFYLMEFEQRMVIDATNGSMARFVNHSCEPNCEMRIKRVDNTPRMALFALRDIMTGEELTYDYNFQPNKQPQECHCGTPSCRGWIMPRPAGNRNEDATNEAKHEMAEAIKKDKSKGKAVDRATATRKMKAAEANPEPVLAAKRAREAKQSAAKAIEKGKGPAQPSEATQDAQAPTTRQTRTPRESTGRPASRSTLESAQRANRRTSEDITAMTLEALENRGDAPPFEKPKQRRRKRTKSELLEWWAAKEPTVPIQKSFDEKLVKVVEPAPGSVIDVDDVVKTTEAQPKQREVIEIEDSPAPEAVPARKMTSSEKEEATSAKSQNSVVAAEGENTEPAEVAPRRTRNVFAGMGDKTSAGFKENVAAIKSMANGAKQAVKRKANEMMGANGNEEQPNKLRKKATPKPRTVSAATTLVASREVSPEPVGLRNPWTSGLAKGRTVNVGRASREVSEGGAKSRQSLLGQYFTSA